MAIESVVFLTFLGLAAAIDWKRRIVPDWLNGAIAAGGLARTWPEGWTATLQALAAALIAGSFLLALRWLFWKLRGLQGLGLGDVKLIAAMSVWIGLAGLPVAVLIAALSGLAHALVLKLLGSEVTRTLRLPFAPHLALGAAVVWLAGPLAP